MTQIKSLEFKAAGSTGSVTAAFSRFGVIDHDGDVTERGAFTDGAEVVISAYGHKSHAGVLPVGKGRIRVTPTEALLEGQFFMDVPHARDTFEIVKELGSLQEWSYSLHDVKSRRGTFEGKDVQFLERVRVKEVSPVLLGAGIDTRTLVAKGLGSGLHEVEHIHLQHIRRHLLATIERNR